MKDAPLWQQVKDLQMAHATAMGMVEGLLAGLNSINGPVVKVDYVRKTLAQIIEKGKTKFLTMTGNL